MVEEIVVINKVVLEICVKNDESRYSMEKDLILRFLIETVKEAYIQIKDIEKEVSIKGTRDFVTNCDLLVEKYIIGKMKKEFPDIEILSEEFNFDKEKTKRYFVIDPIDGTINFASGLDIWGLQVAYVENENTLASCLYFPKLDLLVSSTEHGGTFINGKEVKVKQYENLDNSLVAFDFSKANEKNYILYQEVSKKIMRVREFGAACYGFSMVANGSIDGYCILQNTPWDIKPGLLACIEAGAKVYRDNFCTIVANSNEIIDLIKNSIPIAFKDGLKY